LLHAFNTRDLDSWQRHLAEDVVIRYPGLRGARDAAAARAYNALLLVAFSDLQFHVIASAEACARVTTIWRFTGTHDGDLVVPGGLIPPTGRPARIDGALVVTIGAGAITKEESYWDRLELMRQLGGR
jgi:ketosteroid isomerase-like protein